MQNLDERINESFPHYTKHPHLFHNSKGNRAALVLVDCRGSYSSTSIVHETMLVALHHFGIPYRLFDLSTASLTAEDLTQCGLVIIAQEYLGNSFNTAVIELLQEAISEDGLGLVNFDGSLSSYPHSFLDLLGIQVDPIPFASDLLSFTDCNHYITSTQQPGKPFRLNRPVTFSMVKPGREGVSQLGLATLGKDQLIFSRHNIPGTAYEPGEYPLLLAEAFGKGRIVQFTCSLRLWQHDFLGHGMGLDGLFWRSIVWAARKPFIMKMMPPFVTLRVDDASGRRDFRYVDIFNQHGYHPLVSCFLDNVPDRLAPFMRSKYEEGVVDWDAHSFDYYRLIPYKFGIGEYSTAELDEIFTRVDRWYAEQGLKPPCTAYCHWGEIGVNSLPYFKKRGRNFLNLSYHAGQTKWDRLPPNWFPFGLDSLFYDYIPEDPDLYTLGAVLPRHLMSPDVLTGSTLCNGENISNDMAKAAERSTLAVHLAVDSGFFAEIITHEQKFSVLSLEETDLWLRLLGQKISHYKPRLVGHELAAKYTKARMEAWLDQVNIDDNGSITVELNNASQSLELVIFTEANKEIIENWEPAEAFQKGARLEAPNK